MKTFIKVILDHFQKNQEVNISFLLPERNTEQKTKAHFRIDHSLCFSSQECWGEKTKQKQTTTPYTHFS